jgi:hypothetical protein
MAAQGMIGWNHGKGQIRDSIQNSQLRLLLRNMQYDIRETLLDAGLYVESEVMESMNMLSQAIGLLFD